MTVGDLRIGTDDTIIPISAYTVMESSTPTVAVDSSGPIGAASVDVTRPIQGWQMLYGKLARLSADGLGNARLYVRDRTTSNKATLGLTLVSVGDRLNIEATVPPVKDSLADAIDSWMRVAGVAKTQYDVDPSIAGRSVVVPGWHGNLWAGLKLWCAVERIEMVDAGDKIHVRPLRTGELSLEAASALTESSTAAQMGQFIEIFDYKNSYKTNALVYPPGAWDDDRGATGPNGWTMDTPVLQAEVGTVTTVDVPVNASLVSVEQPVCVKSVAKNYSGPSAYTVVMNDGIETVDPAKWTANGGKVSVEILEDTTTIRITVTAGRNAIEGSPYRLCMSAGSSSDYSTLRLRGTGVFTSKTRLRFPTGYTDKRLQEVAYSVDSPFVSGMKRVSDVLFGVLSVATDSTPVLNATLPSGVSSAGEAAGSRVRTETGVYRVRTATFGPGSLALTADNDATFQDFANIWGGSARFSDFDALWTDEYTLADFGAHPLRHG